MITVLQVAPPPSAAAERPPRRAQGITQQPTARPRLVAAPPGVPEVSVVPERRRATEGRGAGARWALEAQQPAVQLARAGAPLAARRERGRRLGGRLRFGDLRTHKWPCWHMPNPAASGLPNPASTTNSATAPYATTSPASSGRRRPMRRGVLAGQLRSLRQPRHQQLRRLQRLAAPDARRDGVHRRLRTHRRRHRHHRVSQGAVGLPGPARTGTRRSPARTAAASPGSTG